MLIQEVFFKKKLKTDVTVLEKVLQFDLIIETSKIWLSRMVRRPKFQDQKNSSSRKKDSELRLSHLAECI